jgi:hypothetical protein
MVAKRLIGVRAPAPFQPPAAVRPVPRCPWAASRLRGDVDAFSAYPYCPRLVTGVAGTMSAGKSPDA